MIKNSENKKTVLFITLGCKVNQYETNAMSQKFIEKGYKIAEENADIIIVNTCTVTNMSDRKSRHMLRQQKQKNPKAVIVATGCYAQVAKDTLKEIPEIDLVLGNKEKNNIVEIVEKYIEEETNNVQVKDIMQQKDFQEFGNVVYTEKTRAVIKLQDGCDRFCSFCIIPYASGRVSSRKPENIIEEIEKQVKNGIKEVVLTGIHIASYGKDFKKDYKLIDLLEQINQIQDLQRIRLGSIEPLLINEEFLRRLTKLEKICHQFHLSLQSGCDETLKRMNRRYNTNEFLEIVNLLRKNYEDVILTTDIIVGFPGETDTEFKKTLEFLKQIKFYKMHVFQYSPRKGTKASQMKEQVNPKIKEERSKILINLSNKYQKEYNQEQIGKKIEVLFEENKKGYAKGHTKNYIEVLFETEENLENKIEVVIPYKAQESYIIAKCNKIVTKM